jgi:hypothetical protein
LAERHRRVQERIEGAAEPLEREGRLQHRRQIGRSAADLGQGALEGGVEIRERGACPPSRGLRSGQVFTRLGRGEDGLCVSAIARAEVTRRCGRLRRSKVGQRRRPAASAIAAPIAVAENRSRLTDA